MTETQQMANEGEVALAGVMATSARHKNNNNNMFGGGGRTGSTSKRQADGETTASTESTSFTSGTTSSHSTSDDGFKLLDHNQAAETTSVSNTTATTEQTRSSTATTARTNPVTVTPERPTTNTQAKTTRATTTTFDLANIQMTETTTTIPQSASKKQKTASEWKEEGNRAYSARKYRHALEAYDQGLQACDDVDGGGAGDYPLFLTQGSILSNRAMALIKLEDYAAAEESCTRVLEREQPQQQQQSKEQQEQQPSNDQNNNSNDKNSGKPSFESLRLYKVWFRRAVARENRAREMPLNSTQQHDLIQLAKADLQASLQLLEQDKSIMDKERMGTKKTIAEKAQRIQRMLVQIKQQHQHAQSQLQSSSAGATTMRTAALIAKPKQDKGNNKSSADGVMSTKLPNKRTTPSGARLPTNFPDPHSQKADVLRLLKSRMLGLQQQYQNVTAVHGEAFFLVDWHWWSNFCHYVGMFSQSLSFKEHQQTQGMLSYLPPGASVPDHDEKTEDGKPVVRHRPGPIDNSNLFLLSFRNRQGAAKTTQEVFNEQWYIRYNGSNESDGEKSSPPLKPNLVRGYHYEVIPREVYKALRDWYTEVTPSICCRAVRDQRTGQATIPLYHVNDNECEPPITTNSCGACQAPLNVKLRCTRCLAVHYCDRGCQENHWPVHKGSCRRLDSNEQPVRKSLTGSNGRVGLNNLGNTCFMNAALQCLSHATPLTRHFLSGRFKHDINPSNPLGTGGKLAMAYETVMKDLWMKVGTRSTSPNALKRAISQFAPRFAGFLQHDAQEFLAYLLDGLHEDFNRIRKAPYVEMPDVVGGQDMAVAGARAWDAHKRRNDSLVMDSFYGQFKSTCICPQCNRVSVSFDTFNHVSLEIPQQQTAIVTLSVFVVRACLPERQQVGSRPTRYAVHIRRKNPVSEVIHELSKLTDIPRTRLHLCECADQDIVRIMQDREMVSTLNLSKLLVAYEAEALDAGPGVRPCCHAILRHKVVVGGAGGAPKQSQYQEDDDFIGFPLLVSWPMDWSCRQIWQYLWHVVEDKVDEAVHEQYKEAIEFRLHNGRGKGVVVFPDLMGPQQDGTASRRTSILPRQSDEELVTFVGEGAVDDFLFIYVEWTDLGEGKSDQESWKEALDDDLFATFTNHSSWQESSAKRRAQNARGGVTLDQCFETFVKPSVWMNVICGTAPTVRSMLER